MKKLLTLLFLSISPLLLDAQCIEDETNVLNFEVDEISYELVREKLNWVDASACAVEKGGHLVEINDFFEQKGIYDFLKVADINPLNTIAPDGGGASYIWTGANDREKEGDWYWDGNNDGEGIFFWQGVVDGMPIDGAFTFWGNEPDNYSNQDALGIAITDWPLGNAGQWNDIREINELYYIIEYPQDPSGLGKINTSKELMVYPNPASNILNIRMPGPNVDIPVIVNLFNELGQLCYSVELDGVQLSIPVADLPDGKYFLKYVHENQTYNRVIMIL